MLNTQGIKRHIWDGRMGGVQILILGHDLPLGNQTLDEFPICMSSEIEDFPLQCLNAGG